MAQTISPQESSSFTWSTDYSIVQHPLPSPNSEPWAITVDLQGRIWFVEQGANRLGEYDPATGSIREFAIPTAHSNPEGVAADSEGDIWFTELASNMLGELPAGGTIIREFPIPGISVSLGGTHQSLACGPTTVLPGPSGTVWIACLFSNQIDEFHAIPRVFSSFDLPVFQSGPAGMLLDGKGDLWFAAADSDMLGKAVVSQLQNGTSEGITEFAPRNQTYLFSLSHPTSFLGTSDVIISSLPTPSGLALDSTGRLWITEHVDSSFDSYDATTQSLVRYWTAQTYGANGYSVSFPNGIAVDPSGNVWVGEHYGNRIAEFVPSSGMMTEYQVPCCNSSIAGVYSVALDSAGRLWFVEITGNAIGEMVPIANPPTLTLSVPYTRLTLDPHGSATIPIRLSESAPGGTATTLTLSVSGVSGTGSPQNMTADFSKNTLTFSPGGEASTNLTLSLQGINSGIYYLTLGARDSSSGEVRSAILKLTVTASESYSIELLIPVAIAAVAFAGAAGLLLARRVQRRPVRRRSLSLFDSLSRARTKIATPAPAAA